ncbi:NSP (nuclear shuttle protein)-interacting GTPase [Artemisia annua]|uniref:NSP (Nuclear shuttle protein)-interacting GTPase n=1 Tax=Artemisia annua TaxID=35608 RepID=A0A2U1MZR3_ARTAN|nr:NSP (nuclear shuttle protein)-interacting GTPase [Artemisia annua]
MSSRKEEERNERTIRSLMKLPENRRCINCNSLGPQYVCTNFWTFVCTTCSGIHREFTHRVKSVSMAKFTSQEVSALQGGGNASAKEIYFKEWDAQRQSFPDSSNVERLRDFIKHVYVDRRYSGERSSDKPPRAKTGEVEGSRSPPYENERRYSDRPSPGGRSDGSSRNSYDERRSPGYDQDFKKSPARTDVVNDWRREDRFGNGRRSDDGGSKVEGRSPDRQSNPDMSSPPIVRPVRDILGDSVSPLRVLEPPKANGSRPAVASFQPQRTASSSSLASSNGNPTELRRESSLIDFDADPEPPSTAPVPHSQQTAPAPAPSAAQPTPSNDNWASFDSSPVVKASQPPSSGNLLDMLSELSVPASGNVQPVSNVQVPPFGTAGSAVTPAPAFTPGGASFDAFGNSGGAWQNVHSQQNILPATGIQPPTSSFNQAAGGSLNNQPSSAPSGDSQIKSSIEAKPKELPADLFTSTYSPYAAQGPGWYPAQQYGMGYNMQYNVPQQPMPPGFVQPSKSSNPFDVNDSPAVQAPTFPSMAPLQGALPNMAPPAGMPPTSGMGNAAPSWMPHQASHPLAMPPQGPYGSTMPSGPFMGQVPSNIPTQPRPPVGNFGYDMTSFGAMTNQQQGGLYATPPAGTPNTFSSNPFG